LIGSDDVRMIHIEFRLGKAEIYLTLATIFRRFDLELFETTRKDVDVKHDLFLPQPDSTSKGVKVLVR
jgi:hypothetical protein